MPLQTYPADAIERARQDALDWLTGNGDGYPRSWHQEQLRDERWGEIIYDEHEAPPILGYVALEADGLVERVGIVESRGEQRVHFRLLGRAE